MCTHGWDSEARPLPSALFLATRLLLWYVFIDLPSPFDSLSHMSFYSFHSKSSLPIDVMSCKLTIFSSSKDPALQPPMTAWPVNNQTLESIPYLQYDTTTASWRQVDDQTPPTMTPKSSPPTSLRIVSYNVLASPLLDVWICSTVRWHHILDVILPNAQADIYLLNEVHPTFFQMILTKDWVQREYFVSTYHFNNGPRNNLIISKYPLQNLCRETKNARRSLVAKVEPIQAEQPLWIVASHLHAQHSGYLIRKAQLESMYEYLNTTCGNDPVLIMGDLNFHRDNDIENSNILPPFYDVYRSLNPIPEGTDPSTLTEEQLGITFDTPNNGMTAPMSGAFPCRMRLDRALLKPSTAPGEASLEYVPSSMSIFAKDPVSPTTPDLHPSDHYALQLDFTLKRK